MNLIGAIKSRNYKEFILLLNESTVNDKDNDGKSALYHAVNNKNIKMVDKLLEMGANINVPVYSPLHLAAIKGESKIVGLLIKYGADVNIENLARTTPLLWAINNGDSRIAELLLQRGADPNIKNGKGKYILQIAAEKKHCGLVEALVKNKANVNILNEKGRSLLFQLCNEKWCDTIAKIIRTLLENGADPNIQDNNGDTVLMHCYHIDKIKLLLEFRANPNIVNNKKQTCLGVYAKIPDIDRYQIIKLLLKYGANINGENGSISPLFQVLRDNNLSEKYLMWNGNMTTACIDEILDVGGVWEIYYDNKTYDRTGDITFGTANDTTFDIIEGTIDDTTFDTIDDTTFDTIDDTTFETTRCNLVNEISISTTINNFASTLSDDNIVKKFDGRIKISNDLITENNVISTMNFYGISEITVGVAAEFRDTAMVNFLLKNGADPNITDENNDTSLHFVISKRWNNAVKLLLQYDADIYALNNDKQTPFDLAILTQDKDLINLFVEKSLKAHHKLFLLISSHELDQDSLFYKDFFIRDLFFLLLRNLRY